jgi:O-antigen/teichoic acid export membrane protein
MSLLTQSAQNVLAGGFQVAGRALSGLLIPLLLVPERYGAYVYLAWLATTLIQLSALGLPHAAQRYVARAVEAGERAAIGRLLKASGAALTLMWLVIMLLWEFARGRPWGYGPAAFMLLCTGVTLGVYGAIRVAILKGSQNFAVPAIVEAIGQVAKLAVLLGLLLGGGGISVTQVFSAEVVCWSCQAVILRIRDTTDEKVAPIFGQVPSREILHYIVSVGLIVLVDLVIWQRIEVVFLEGFGFVKEAGFFYLAGQVSALLALVPSVAVAALFPAFAALQRDDPARLERVYEMAAAGLWVVGVPCLAVGLFLAPEILVGIYGESYREITLILPFVLVGRISLLVGGVASVLVYATGRQRALLPVVLGGAALTLVGDFALIPFFGLIGAGISVATVQPLVAVGTLVLARRIVARTVPLRGPTLAAAVVALGCGVVLAQAGWPGSAVAAVTMLYWAGCSLDPSVQRLVVEVCQRMRVVAARLARS